MSFRASLAWLLALGLGVFTTLPVVAQGPLLEFEGGGLADEVAGVMAEDEVELGIVEVAGVAVESFDCPAGLRAFNIEPNVLLPTGGQVTRTDGTAIVTLTKTNLERPLRFFDFQANVAIDSAIVSGGSMLRFDFTPEVNTSQNLHAGANHQGLPQDVRQISFCY